MVTPLRILLVDNESDVRGAIALLLSIDKHSVIEASGGEEALQALSQHEFDLVITDFRMDGMLGDELAGRIKGSWPDVRVIMLTGFAPGQPGEANPVDLILYKPCGLDDLRKAIDNLFGA